MPFPDRRGCCGTSRRTFLQDTGLGFTGLALSAMLEGLWLRLMMGTEDVTRESAHHAAREFLASAFPKHFSQPF